MPLATKITFQVDGPEFLEGVPVLKVIEALREFHSTVDKSYLAIIGKAKLTRTDRIYYKLTATKIGISSFHTDINIIVPVAQVALGFVPVGIGLSHVWDVAKNAFSFLKTLASFRRTGQEPRVEITASRDASQLVVVGSNNNITVNQVVYEAANRSESNIKSLAQLVDGQHIQSISALDEREDGIKLLPPDNDLFNPQTSMDNRPLKLSAKIFRLDVESRTGRLRTLGTQPEGIYAFTIVGKQPLHPYVLALESAQSTVTALREIVVHPTGLEVVSAYHVLEVSP